MEQVEQENAFAVSKDNILSSVSDTAAAQSELALLNLKYASFPQNVSRPEKPVSPLLLQTLHQGKTLAPDLSHSMLSHSLEDARLMANNVAASAWRVWKLPCSKAIFYVYEV